MNTARQEWAEPPRAQPNTLGESGAPAILRPGRNCWRIARARRAAFFVDGAEYFRALRAALRRARHSVFIVGWDFDGDIRLDPVEAPDESLASLITSVVDERPDLHVRILVWGFSTFYGANHQPAVSLAEPWYSRVPRIAFAFDNNYPLGASHHEKIVCIDDALAFVGGIDLTAERWDTPAHAFDDPHRHEYDGAPFLPVHDLHMAVDGAAARAVADLVRERWADATGELAPATPSGDPWPPAVSPALRDVDVGIARTRPGYGESAPVREIEALNSDALGAARRSIYLETQYLTAQAVGDALAAQLERPNGPEILVVVTKESDGWVEHFAMGTNRDRLLRRLKAADRHGRLRVYYPVVPKPEGGTHPVGIHSKLMIVDDRFLRIGSSNLNNRSMGVDTECDLAVEARDDAIRAAITALRNRLIAEHIGAEPRALAAAIAQTGSLIAAVDALNNGPRRLCPLDVEPDESAAPIPGTAILDPAEPINLSYLRQKLLSD